MQALVDPGYCGGTIVRRHPADVIYQVHVDLPGFGTREYRARGDGEVLGGDRVVGVAGGPRRVEREVVDHAERAVEQTDHERVPAADVVDAGHGVQGGHPSGELRRAADGQRAQTGPAFGRMRGAPEVDDTRFAEDQD